MSTKEDQTDEVRKLLALMSPLEVRSTAIEALRVCYKRDRKRLLFMHGDLGLEFVTLLSKFQTINTRPIVLKEVFATHQRELFMAPVVEFLWWLIRTGCAVPVDFQNRNLLSLEFTAAGVRFLESPDDHPLSPGFIGRLQSRCSELSDAVISRLEDAHTCLDHGLLRPALILLGLAYETAIEHILLAISAKGLWRSDQIAKAKAQERLELLKKALSGLNLSTREVRRTNMAIDFADQLRERRNEGAHSALESPFNDREEIEELLVSAGRHLPTLWQLAKTDLKTSGP